MPKRNVRVAMAGLAAAVAVVAVAAFGTPAQAGMSDKDVVRIRESIIINESPVALWHRFGGYCDLGRWVPPIKSCKWEKGSGEQGSVRRLDIDGVGEVVEVMSDKQPTGYTYDMLEGFLADAKYHSTIWAVPGPRAGTAQVNWETTILKSAFPDDHGIGMAATLAGLYAASLEHMKALAE